MAERRAWKAILGAIAIACRASVITAALFGGCSDALEHKTRVGVFRYKEWPDSKSYVRIRKPDGASVDIRYEDGVAKDWWFFHPAGHPLSGRVRPAADGRTLHEATELLPTLIAIAKGDNQKINQRVLSLLQDHFPAELYRLVPEKEPGKYHLQINDNLYLRGYDFRPHARMPYVAYWGPQLTDVLGDDVIYCGDWVLDKFCQNLPLKVGPEKLHRVKAGDVIDFAGCKLMAEYIDWDNDQDPRNNSLILRVEGTDLAIIQKSQAGGQPIEPRDFVKAVCWPRKVHFQDPGQIRGPVSQEEFEQQIRTFANSRTESERGAAVKDILLDAGYTRDDLITADVKDILLNAGFAEEDVIRADSGYQGSQDIWVIKKGQSDEAVIIAAHYDKTGEESQGVIDNACGVLVAASIARALQTMKTHLTYIFLFYGAHEVGRGHWSIWLVGERPLLRVPVKYAVNIEGGGLVGSEQTFRLEQSRHRGWLHWRFPELRINETGGPPDYLKHTEKDNIAVCDFSRLVKSQNVLLQIALAIENNL